MPGIGRPPAARLIALATVCSARTGTAPRRGHAAPRPSTRSCGRSAASTNAMCSSSGTPELGGALQHVLAAHAPRERLVLELLLDAGDLEILEAPRRPHQRAGHQEPAQLVHREERPGHRRVARHAGVVRVSEDGARRSASGSPRRGEDPHAFGRVLLGGRMGGVGKALVVEVVQQADQAPRLRVLAARARPWPAWRAPRRTCASGARRRRCTPA